MKTIMMIVGTSNLMKANKVDARQSHSLSGNPISEIGSSDDCPGWKRDINKPDSYCCVFDSMVKDNSNMVASKKDPPVTTLAANDTSKEEMVALRHSLLPVSHPPTEEPCRIFYKQLSSPDDLLNNDIDQDRLFKIGVTLPAPQGQTLLDVTKEPLLIRADTSESVYIHTSDVINVFDDKNDENDARQGRKACLEGKNIMHTKVNSEQAANEQLTTEEISIADPKPFCWTSSKMRVFINGKPIDTSIPVPKYNPKERKRKLKKRRRKIARERAAHEAAMARQIDRETNITETSGMPPLMRGTRPRSLSVDSRRRGTQTNENVIRITSQSRSRSNKDSSMQLRISQSLQEDGFDHCTRQGQKSNAHDDYGRRSHDMGHDEDVKRANHEWVQRDENVSNKRKRDLDSEEGLSLTREEILQHRQVEALHFLKTATDYGSMQAALDLIHELHNDIKLNKEVRASVDQAMIAIPYLMHTSMKKFLTVSRNDGGPGFSAEKANRITMDLFERMGPACCGDKVSEDDLMVIGGLHKVEALRVLPHLLRVAATVRDQHKAIRMHVFAQTATGERALPATESNQRRSSARNRHRLSI